MAEERTRHFHECIISFITTDIRLSKWHWLSTWSSFHREYRCPLHQDWTSMELRKEFRDSVLPTIFNHDLSHDQRQKIGRLPTYQVCGPPLETSATGFLVVPIEKDIDTEFHKRIKENVDFVTSMTQNLDNIAMTILKPKDFDQVKTESGGNMPVRKCVSLVMQNDSERLQEYLLTWPEIQRRWRSRQDLADYEDIMKEVAFFEKLQLKSKKVFQIKINRWLLEMRQRQDTLIVGQRQSQDFEAVPSTSQGTGIARRPLTFT